MKISNTTTDYQTSPDILREQRQIRRERFFSSPGLFMGLTVFILIVTAAIIIPLLPTWIPMQWPLRTVSRGQVPNIPLAPMNLAAI